MSETYRNSTEHIYLDIFGGTLDAPPVVTCTTPDGLSTLLPVEQDNPIEDAAQRFVVVLGLAQTQHAGEVKVQWSFSMNGVPTTKVDYFDVVVPLASIDFIRDELELDANYSDDDLRRLERRVRTIVENATGQVFAPVKETLWVNGNGTDMVRLPKRLLEIDSVGGNTAFPTQYKVVRDGYALMREFPYFPGIIVAGGVPIVEPYSREARAWRQNQYFQISGTWGWERVPRQIQEAALILLEEKACPESIYAERYLVSMTAADWRIQFDSGAYKGTGNVVADQILAGFQVSHMGVI